MTKLPAILSSLACELYPGAATLRTPIPGRHAVTRIVDIPPLPQDDLKRAVASPLRRYVPIPPDKVTFDATPLPDLTARDGCQKILLLALRRNSAKQHIQVLRAPGLEPLLLHVEPLATFNTIAAFITRNGRPLACRILTPSSAGVVRNIATTTRIEHPQAVALFRQGCDPSTSALPCFKRCVTRVARHLRSPFHPFRRAFDCSCQPIYVTGQFAGCPGVPTLINRATHFPALRLYPFVNVNLGALDNRVGTLRAHAAAFAPAMDLTVRSLHWP